MIEKYAEKTNNISMSFERKEAENHNIKIGNKSYESVAKFRYLGTILIDQNCIYGEFKRRMNSENACHSSVQYLLLLHLLSKSIKIKRQRTIIVPALFQASTVKQLRTVLFWVIMHQVVVRNYQYSLHNNPEDQRFYNFAYFIWVGKLISNKQAK